MHSETAPQPDEIDTAPTVGTEHRTKFEAVLWLIFGGLGAYGGIALAILWTIPVVEADTDDFAGLLFLATVPLGFVIGTIVAMMIARTVERSSPSAGELFTRTQLAFMGVLLPILLWFAAAFAYGAVLEVIG